MTATATVLAGRRRIEALMIDRVRVYRPDPDVPRGPMDPETGQYPERPTITVYEGRGRIQVRADINSNAVEAVVGDRESTYRTATFQLPMHANADAGDVGDTAAILPDDTAKILACPLDEGMVGREVNLRADTKGKTHATHRRFKSTEVIQ